jgi:hypothetical protein
MDMPDNNNSSQQISPRKKGIPVLKNLWFWAVVVLGIIIVAMGAYILRSEFPFKNGKAAKISAANIAVKKQDSFQKPISFGQQDLDNIDPGWTLFERQPIVLNNKTYFAAVLANDINTEASDAQVRISIFENINNQWHEAWTIPKDIDYFNHNIANSPAANIDFIVLQDSKAALAVVNIPTDDGSNSGWSEVVAVTVDSAGNYNLQAMDANSFYIVQKIDNQQINVTGEGWYGIHEMYLQNGEFHQDVTPRSQMTPPQAVQAKFIVGLDGTVYPANAADLTVHAGQTIAFVPANDQAKELFNSGKICIFHGSPVGACRADEIFQGNSITESVAGSDQILLMTEDQAENDALNVSQPTFNVTVQP